MFLFFFVMIRRLPRFTRTDTLFPYTTLFRSLLARLQAANVWVDLGRKFVPAPQRLYTWWSYRARDWSVSDRGRRLDHMWASPDIAHTAVAHRVVEPCRGWSRPSDRSEETTFELQSLMRISYAVFCLKKNKTHIPSTNEHPNQ